MTNKLNIALVRRGYSPSGGAEAYLKRLAHGIVEAGHEVQLIATDEWPDDQWPFGAIRRLRGKTVTVFANELELSFAAMSYSVLSGSGAAMFTAPAMASIVHGSLAGENSRFR